MERRKSIAKTSNAYADTVLIFSSHALTKILNGEMEDYGDCCMNADFAK